MTLSMWEVRAQRAADLAKDYPFARDLLKFYQEIVLFQKDLYTYLAQHIPSEMDAHTPCPFHSGALDSHLALLLNYFPAFLSLVKRVGSDELSQWAHNLSSKSQQSEWPILLESYWRKDFNTGNWPDDLSLLFFPRAFLQPYAEYLAENHTKDPLTGSEEYQEVQGGEAFCPLCGSRPQLGVLRIEGEGAKRSLLCSLCATEWRYKRLCCPACGEERFSKLSYHTTSDFPHVRIEVCESCRIYIKGIDLTTNGLAVPVVDEMATIPLDLWAAEQGYMKIEMNLIGI